jgi:hypothetical protein
MKKKKGQAGPAIPVVAPLEVWRIDWSEFAQKLSPGPWTRGPVIPVWGTPPATNGKRRAKGRKKKN